MSGNHALIMIFIFRTNEFISFIMEFYRKKNGMPFETSLYTIGRLIVAEDLNVSNSRIHSLTINYVLQK